MGLTTLILGFLLGVVTSLIGIFGALHWILSAEARHADRELAASRRRREQQLAASSNELVASISSEDPKGWIRLRRDSPFKIDGSLNGIEAPLSWVVLKSNMLFQFASDKVNSLSFSGLSEIVVQSSACGGVMCLDGCSILIVRAKHAKFHKNNFLHVEHTTKDLLPGRF